MEANEEWNNFMHRVTEISNIVSALTSSDKEKSAKAQTLADNYLAQGNVATTDENVNIKIKHDRTVINEMVCHKKERPLNSNEMDPEMFMKQVSRDADQRATDKKVRIEKADTFKRRASKAFRRGDYETALSCYDKAIEQIKDSCILYTNRALTLIKLEKYEKVFHDCEWALRLNENNFKAHLYNAKAHQGTDNREEFERCYNEVIHKFPEYKKIIEEFLKSNKDIETNDNI